MGARTSALLAQHPSSRQKVPSSRWTSGRKPVQERSTPPPGGGDMRSNGAQLLRFTRDGGDVSGIRTNAAAELLGVSPNTLRSWERRFGYPRPRRTQGGHRQYDLAELEALRRALLETHNISSAIEVARQRGEGPSSPSRLLDAFDRFDETAADRVLEESLAERSIRRPSSSAAARPPSMWSAGWYTPCARSAPRRRSSSTASPCPSPATTP